MDTRIKIKRDRVVKEKVGKLVKTSRALSSFYEMTPELEKLLGPIEDDIKHGRNLSPAFEDMKEMDKYLDSL